VALNFGQLPFRYPPEGGFRGVQQADVAHTTASGSIRTSDDASGRKMPLALIVEPTRELAQQVDTELARFKKYLTDPAIAHACFVGGMSSKQALSVRDAVSATAPKRSYALIIAFRLLCRTPVLVPILSSGALGSCWISFPFFSPHWSSRIGCEMTRCLADMCLP